MITIEMYREEKIGGDVFYKVTANGKDASGNLVSEAVCFLVGGITGDEEKCNELATQAYYDMKYKIESKFQSKKVLLSDTIGEKHL